jgi:hypothetical protein
VRPTDVREHLEAQPFGPFRLFLSDGETLDVRHPDMCIVSRSAVYVGVADRRSPGVAQRVTQCSLLHITRIEPLNGAAPRPSRRRRE